MNQSKEQRREQVIDAIINYGLSLKYPEGKRPTREEALELLPDTIVLDGIWSIHTGANDKAHKKLNRLTDLLPSVDIKPMYRDYNIPDWIISGQIPKAVLHSYVMQSKLFMPDGDSQRIKVPVPSNFLRFLKQADIYSPVLFKERRIKSAYDNGLLEKEIISVR